MYDDLTPDPDSEVPKSVRDEFFDRMKSKQSERVRFFAASESIFAESALRAPHIR